MTLKFLDQSINLLNLISILIHYLQKPKTANTLKPDFKSDEKQEATVHTIMIINSTPYIFLRPSLSDKTPKNN